MNRQPVAFVEGVTVARARHAEGPLSGLTFAVKDNIALRGHRSSAGHPTWASTHEPAGDDASVVKLLLDAGADLVGVTIMDELAYSLAGQNPHYGTPTNAAAPTRLCGGSSCGSAAAVTACLCDFALGTDTSGSVRVPSAFCGLFGLRPSFGRLSLQGVVPLAESFDTVGLMARDVLTFDNVARVLLGASNGVPLTRVVVADDAFALCDAGVLEVLDEALQRIVGALSLEVERVELSPEGFEPLRNAVRRLGAREIWEAHGAWLQAARPEFSPSIAARFEMAREVYLSEEGAAEDNALRMRLRHRIEAWLTPGTVLVLPPAPGVAPRSDAAGDALETFRARTLELTAAATLTGVPQLVVPCADDDGPLALSFIGARDSDAWLAGLATPIARALD